MTYNYSSNAERNAGSFVVVAGWLACRSESYVNTGSCVLETEQNSNSSNSSSDSEVSFEPVTYHQQFYHHYQHFCVNVVLNVKAKFGK